MNNGLKYGLYYASRNYIWQLIYFLYAGLGVGGISAIYAILSSSVTIVALSDVLKTHGIQADLTQHVFGSNAIAAIIMAVFILIMLGGIICRWALRKMFFKPYARFQLAPKIEDVSIRMGYSFFIFSLILAYVPQFIFGAICYNDAFFMFHSDLSNFSFENLSVSSALSLLFKKSFDSVLSNCCLGYIETFLISYYFVKKYAEITES